LHRPNDRTAASLDRLHHGFPFSDLPPAWPTAHFDNHSGLKAMTKKGLLLAGGSGSRLDPMTRVVCKHLLPVYDKPMIYYPLSTLMLGGLREVLIISSPRDLPAFRELLGDGRRLGMRLEYAEQAEPGGIAQALLIGDSFLAGSGAALALGDNIFYGTLDVFRQALTLELGACIFGYHVADPGQFGVVEFDSAGRIVSLEEKPAQPRSNFAVPGLYVYDGTAVERARRLVASGRGELEITDLNRSYLQDGQLEVRLLGRGFGWLDAGTPMGLLEAGNFIATIERRQNLKVACLEEIAWNRGFIDRAGFEKLIAECRNPDYRRSLESVLAAGLPQVK
jgi:glucose-1-phosphate thymidylyltransferase